MNKNFKIVLLGILLIVFSSFSFSKEKQEFTFKDITKKQKELLDKGELDENETLNEEQMREYNKAMFRLFDDGNDEELKNLDNKIKEALKKYME